jgi:hypothetical protein
MLTQCCVPKLHRCHGIFCRDEACLLFRVLLLAVIANPLQLLLSAALLQELIQWQFKNKLLITGTPLQNSLKELWALLHFLDQPQFSSLEEFEAKYNLEKGGLLKLRAVLSPHLLRRLAATGPNWSKGALCRFVYSDR